MTVADDAVFINNTVKVKAALSDEAIAWLYEVAGEIVSQAKINSRVDTGQLKGSWRAVVDESKGEATIGSELENAIWEEYGTGTHAEGGNGRQGWWVYVKGSSGVKSESPKTLTYEQAKFAVARLRAKGLDAHMTQGKTPNHTLERAFRTVQPKAVAALEERLKGMK